jgi:hypothetical protein
MTKPLYFYNGTTFEQIGPTTPQSPIAYQTSAPTGPATGDLWIDSDGDVDTYNRQLTRYYFVATAAQTTITGTDANGLTLAYVAGSEAVYVNGALQVRGQDYTATNGTSVTGLTALAVNDVVEIFAYTAFTVANAYTKSETDGIAAAAAGLRMVVPTSVSVGSGSGSVDALGNVTFSGASSVLLNSCFSSTYDNYLIQLEISTMTSGLLNWRLANGGTTAQTNYVVQDGRISGTALAASLNASQTTARLFSENQTEVYGNLNLFSPFLAANTRAVYDLHTLASGTTIYRQFGTSVHQTATSYAQIQFYPSTGTMTGTMRVYGYKK